MILGSRAITSGDNRRYRIDYCEFLQEGEYINAFSVTDNGATSTAGNATLDVTYTALFFFVLGGVVGETFTVSVQITTTYGEIVNDTIAYTVVAP